MATAAEQRTEIAVHNPATGEVIRSVHATSIDATSDQETTIGSE